MKNLEINNIMRIAGNLTNTDWFELSKTLDNDCDDNWSLAFYFFEERIKTRYLIPIQSILAVEDNLGEGFAVVNLQCSLIETIESFINGWKYDTFSNSWFKIKGEKINLSSKEIFNSFFANRKPFSENMNISGENFYRHVRCALLHETQTKDNWQVRRDTLKSGLVYEEIAKGDVLVKIIYRENFQYALEGLISFYKQSIITGNEFNEFSGIELRNNFREKFNNICTQS